MFTAGAQAVHDLGIIELDANIANDAGPGTDWGAIFDSSGNTVPANLPAGTIDTTGVIRDFEPGGNADTSYHESSNKDAQAINPAGASNVWGCSSVQNATDKDDIVNAYALAADVSGDLVMYYGVERFDNSGSAFLGMWFFQADVSCNLSTGKFEGQKTTGDILILSNFTNGGAITVLRAYRYTAGAGPSDPGTFTEIASGIDCDAGPGPDNLCANVNLGDVVTPWPMEDKTKPGPPNPDPPNTLEVSEFFEGGINLTNVFEAAGLTPPECFGAFMAETRTSPGPEGDVDLNAALKDFALGDLTTCFPDVHVAKTSSVSSVNAGGSYNYTITGKNDGNQDATGVVITDNLNDTLTVNTATFDVDPNTAGGTGTCTVGAGNTISCSVGTLAASDGNTTGAEPDTVVVTINVTTTVASCPSVANTSHITAVNERVEDQSDNDSNPVTVNVLCSAIKILKNSTKGGAVSNPGTLFTVTGSVNFTVKDNNTPTPAGSRNDELASTVGVVCVSGLPPGTYSVTETTPPAGYGGASPATQNVTATAGTDCSTNQPTGNGIVTFSNPPLADIQVNFRDGGSGETSAIITCVDQASPTPPLAPTSTTPPTGWETSKTYEDLNAPKTVVCTIAIDP